MSTVCLLRSELNLRSGICVAIIKTKQHQRCTLNCKQLCLFSIRAFVLNCPLSGRHTSGGSDPSGRLPARPGMHWSILGSVWVNLAFTDTLQWAGCKLRSHSGAFGSNTSFHKPSSRGQLYGTKSLADVMRAERGKGGSEKIWVKAQSTLCDAYHNSGQRRSWINWARWCFIYLFILIFFTANGPPLSAGTELELKRFTRVWMVTDIGWIFWWMQNRAVVDAASSCKRYSLAQSIPSQGLIGQVERPDVTPNPHRSSGSLCAPQPPPLEDLKALQGSLGTSPPLFVPSSTGPSHDVIAFLKGFKLANYNKPFLSKQPPLKEIFLCCTLGLSTFLSVPEPPNPNRTWSHTNGLFFCFDFSPPECVSSLLFFIPIVGNNGDIYMPDLWTLSYATNVFTQRAAHQLANWSELWELWLPHFHVIFGKIKH